jgi:drug/metabolite transporter (DMT)-like permease
LLVFGVIISFIGITVANVGNSGIGIGSIISNFFDGENLIAYILGFIVSLSWGLYTNLTKKFIKDMDVDGSGIFMLLSGLILGVISFKMDEPRAFSASLVGQIIYASIVVSSLANVFWNLSIRKGNMLIVVLTSNFLPIISTIITALLLGYKITFPHIVGSLLVVIGTIWSKKCL